MVSKSKNSDSPTVDEITGSPSIVSSDAVEAAGKEPITEDVSVVTPVIEESIVEKSEVIVEEKEVAGSKPLSEDDVIVMQDKPVATPFVESQRSPFQRNFNGMVDNRVLPDADLPTEYVEGVLSISDEGHGYLRPKFIPGEKDVYISASQIRRFSLRKGDHVGGQARSPKENERYYGLLKVEKVNGFAADAPEIQNRPYFEDLTPIFPQPQIMLETESDVLTTRMIDLVSPIGYGQRGLVVSPPKAGKTWLIKDIAEGITKNYPDIHLMAILIGERPEEVTELQRIVNGEVVASNFDEAPEYQTKTAEIALERAKRLVELGKDVFVILDSITRIARAYNLAMPTSGRTLSGGFDPAALFPAKHFFGAARKIENGGSLTIIGTCLIDTGSRMDDLIYEEFKGTGNMELHLDRRLAERRVFPAIDIQRSGTRREELLYDKPTFEKVVTMRRMIDMLGSEERTDVFVERLKKEKTNKDFLDALKQG